MTALVFHVTLALINMQLLGKFHLHKLFGCQKLTVPTYVEKMNEINEHGNLDMLFHIKYNFISDFIIVISLIRCRI